MSSVDPIPQEPVLYIEPAGRDGIPAHVLATIMTLIGAAYPDAQMGPGQWAGRGFGLVLPEGAKPKRVSKKAAKEAVEEPDEYEVGFVGWDGESLSTTVPEELAHHLARVAYAWLSAVEGAVNYIEQTVTHPEHPDKPLVFSVAWSKGQTPHEIRQRVERERDMLAQAMWDARKELGFDNDGDPSPGAAIAGSGYDGFAREHVREAREQAAAYDEALGEIPTAEQVWQAWHGTDEPWGGCADKEAVMRILRLVTGA